MKLSDFDFELPKSLIAQFPSEKRTDSKLLVAGKSITDTTFSELGDYLKPNDLLVLNDTRVIPARLFGQKESGGRVEILIERLLSDTQSLAMIKASRSPKIGSFIVLENGQKVENYNEDLVKEYMKWDAIDINIILNTGRFNFTVYTCDFTHDYIDINADYRN